MDKQRVLTNFENDVSFSFVVDLKVRKSGKTVVYLKPYVCVINCNKERLQAIRSISNIEFPEYALNVGKWDNKRLVLQNMNDVQEFINMFDDYEWLYDSTKETFDFFVKTFKFVEVIGTKHEQWSDDIEVFINMRDVINPTTRSLGKPWIEKVKKHLLYLPEFND